MTDVSSRRWWSVALAVYWLGLTLGTHYPSVRVPDAVSHTDKIVHCASFAGLALLACIALRVRRVVLAAIVLAAYAAVDESTQQLVGRNSDVLDWIADTVGVVIGCGVFTYCNRARRRRTARPDGSDASRNLAPSPSRPASTRP